MNSFVESSLVEKWLKGWSLSRGLPLPVAYNDAFKVEVGWPDQKQRYVFPHLTDGLPNLMASISEPFILLKVCATAQAVRPLLLPGWEIQPERFMMVSELSFTEDTTLPSGYSINITEENGIFILRILDGTNETASTGKLILVEDMAVFDKVETAANHQRKGLASKVMAALANIALSQNRTKGILVATPAGRKVYEKLGWKRYSDYTTIAIQAH